MRQVKVSNAVMQHSHGCTRLWWNIDITRQRSARFITTKSRFQRGLRGQYIDSEGCYVDLMESAPDWDVFRHIAVKVCHVTE
jgi:hypothetical protein